VPQSRPGGRHETRQGACRLLTPITHELTAVLPLYAQRIAGPTEFVAHTLARSSPGAIEIRTPLSRTNTINAQQRGKRSANRRPDSGVQPIPSCRTCGEPLTEPGRQLCPACWPVTRSKLATERVKAANKALADMRARGDEPSQTAEAAEKRSRSLSERKQQEQAWTPGRNDADWTLDRYQRDVLPELGRLSLSQIQEATGLSTSACSRIRSGKLTPHRRHWPVLSSAVSE
jgi:hypothetical protein